MSRTVLVAALALSCTLGATEARADLISLTASLQGGGASGEGLSGDRKADAFSKGAEGATYGFGVGVELLMVDVWVEHAQYMQSGGLAGTWTQFMAGFDTELDFGSAKGGKAEVKNGKSVGQYSRWFFDLGFAAGFGVGTGQQIDPPLDNSEITDKGALLQVHGGLGVRLSKQFSLGLVVPAQYRFMFKSDDGAVVNDVDTHYRSVAFAGLLNLRFKLKLK